MIKETDLGARVILNMYSKRNRPMSIDDFSDKEKQIRDYINDNKDRIIKLALKRFDASSNQHYKDICKDWLENKHSEATIGKTYNLNTSTVYRVIHWFAFYMLKIAQIKIDTNADSLYCYPALSNRSINWLSRKRNINSDIELISRIVIRSKLDFDNLSIYTDCGKYSKSIKLPAGTIKEIKEDKILYKTIQEIQEKIGGEENNA